MGTHFSFPRISAAAYKTQMFYNSFENLNRLQQRRKQPCYFIGKLF